VPPPATPLPLRSLSHLFFSFSFSLPHPTATHLFNDDHRHFAFLGPGIPDFSYFPKRMKAAVDYSGPRPGNSHCSKATAMGPLISCIAKSVPGPAGLGKPTAMSTPDARPFAATFPALPESLSRSLFLGASSAPFCDLRLSLDETQGRDFSRSRPRVSGPRFCATAALPRVAFVALTESPRPRAR
jgi:hypothetical protein